jgi:hypothetical protein
MAQTHYCLPSDGLDAFSLGIDLEGAQASCAALFYEQAGEGCGLYPYGYNEPLWWQYSVAPHSYLPLDGGNAQVGLNYFNRFLHIDLVCRSASLIDPKVGDQMLSSTNHYDGAREDIWFASWTVEDTVKRILDPRGDVVVTAWRYSLRKGRSDRIWQGLFSDSIHQVAVNQGGRFLLAVELGLVPAGPLPADPLDIDREEGRSLLRGGLVPSRILAVDLHTGREWRLWAPTAAHVEFDPLDPSICYFSVHNIGLAHGRVCIFGQGSILAFRLGPEGFEKLGEATAPDFYRITSHIAFRHRGRTLIGVTGYPNTLFLIEAASMRIIRRIRLFDGETVDIRESPHPCGQDSYGIVASADGEYALVAGTGFINIISVADGALLYSGCIDGYDRDSCFTGHICSIL